MPDATDHGWLAAVVDISGGPIATAILLDHREGLVPEAVLDSRGSCQVRFPEGFTKEVTAIRRARGMALVDTGGETGPRRPPLGSRPQSSLAGPCLIQSIDRTFSVATINGTFSAGGAFVEATTSPDQPLAGGAVLIDGQLVAVVQYEQSGGLATASLSELLNELRPPVQQQVEPVQAASKTGPPPNAPQVQGPSAPAFLPFTPSTATAYGLGVAIGSTRPSGLPPTDAGVLLLGLLVAGRGPLANEPVPAALFRLLDEKAAERLIDGVSAVRSSADPASLEPAPVDGQPYAGSEEVVTAANQAAVAAGATAVAMAQYAPAVVGAAIDPDVLAALGVTQEQLQTAVRQAGGQAVDQVLAGPFASDQLHLSKGEKPGDELGTRVYATMLATLIAKEGTPMPLSIGLFGEWGSGKSYFMELLRSEVDALVATKRPPYLESVVQLTFNAWHYSDTNLWASLGAEFFEQLLGPQADPDEARRKQLRQDLAANQELAKELSAAQDAAVAKAGELRSQLETATQSREANAQKWDAHVLTRVAADGDVQAALKPIGKKLGLGTDVKAVVALAKDVDGLRSDVAAVGQVLLHRRWRWTLLAVLVATTAAAAAVVASDRVGEWLSGGSLLAFAAAIGTVGRAVGLARGAVSPLREAAAKARAIEEQMRTAPASEEEQKLANALKEQEAKTAVISAQLKDTVARAAQLDQELGELHPGRRLYRFIADRVSSADYRGQLGIVSTVRHDFEELSRLMKEAWRSDDKELAEGVKPIDRIVLYIDDLDRCEPQQVVAVLQAVHLLMAMDLFVVVVGVDPRWLLRSLRRQYRGVLGGTPGVDGFWASTPQNYLEKIFQVPFVLPGMGHAGFDALLRSLAKPKRTVATTNGTSGESAAQQPAAGAGAQQLQPIDTESASELDRLASGTQTTGAPPPPPPAPAEQDLTEKELRFLAHLADLVATPRAAKRLFNIYALLRTTRSVWPGSSFLGSEAAAGEYQAVGQLLAILASRPDLLGILMWGRRSDGTVEQRALCRQPADGATWETFVAGLEPRQSASGWENDVADTLTPEELTAWRDLVAELKQVLRHVKLQELEPYRHWAPKIARFSFVLSPFADDAPDQEEPQPGVSTESHAGA